MGSLHSGFTFFVYIAIQKGLLNKLLQGNPSGASPGIVLGKLFPAASLGPLESRQLVTATALLTKSLQFSCSYELLLLDVHLTDVAALVVGAQVAELLAASLHLAERCRLCLRGQRLEYLVLGHTKQYEERYQGVDCENSSNLLDQ